MMTSTNILIASFYSFLIHAGLFLGFFGYFEQTAKPNKILPRAAKTKAAGGTKPKKNSIQTTFILLALISSGSGGPSSGLIQHLNVVYAAYKLAKRIPGIIHTFINLI